MQLNKLYLAVGASRDEHAAQIMQANDLCEQYAELHANAFAEKGLKKYLHVNAKNEVLEAFDKPMHVNGTLRHEDFLTIQDRIVEIRRRALNGIMDLQAAGLSFSADIGEQLVGFENVNEFSDAGQEMNPNSYDNNDTVLTESYVPNPITHSSFSVPFRQQGFDYKRSLGMSESIRKVAERLEKTLFNGNGDIVINFNGTNFPIYGYTTHPDRGTGTISDWTLEANVEKIVPEAVDQIGLMWKDQGGVANDSVIMYVANDIWNALQKDYKAGVTGTVLDRVKDIAQIRDVKPAEKLTSKEVVFVEMDARTIELAVATDIISVPHQKTSPLAPQVMTTYAAMVQQIKTDANNNTGIRHLSPA